MATIKRVSEDMERRIGKSAQIFLSAVGNSRALYFDLLRRQWRRGRQGTGRIGTYKNESYARFKHDLNPLAGLGNVDLILTGAYNEELYMELVDKGFRVGSRDEKAGRLEAKYGVDIYDVGEGRREFLRAVFQDAKTSFFHV